MNNPLPAIPRYLTIALLVIAAVRPAAGQDGFERLVGKHVELITDLPLDDSLRELPEVFDAAIPLWCRFFAVDPAEVKDWKTQACIMLERQRFKRAGMLPDSLPEFPHGYQWKDQLWVIEQPTAYYRRHLLLHEGTHWFMTRRFGSAGPPWLMEGTAEWLATHRWKSGQLELGVIPHARDDVPMWGRISLIQNQLRDGRAPSLDTILRYNESAHQNVDAYAWSWAAVIFLHHHPATKRAFHNLLNDRLRSDGSSTRQLLKETQPRKALMRAEWSAMLTGLEYGFEPTRELVQLDHRAKQLSEPWEGRLSAARGWQAIGKVVEVGQQFEVIASGQYVVGNQPKPWSCQPDGVTLRYVQGHPLGKVLLAIAEPQTRDPEHSQPLPVIAIGAQAVVTADRSGHLLMRINELGAALDDNSGEISIRLIPR